MTWYFASCARGLHPLLAEEIETLGGQTIRIDPGGVSFQATSLIAQSLCLWSRVANRVFEELVRGRIEGPNAIYDVARRVEWNDVMSLDQTFSVTSRVSGGIVTDSRYASLKVKDAIVDHFREATQDRPDVDTDEPVVPLRLTIRGKVATLSRDLVGGSLHKRGYRLVQHKSPVNEALAAGMLLLSDWDRASSVCDPMCGSATFLIEAIFIAGDRAPGLHSDFAFELWNDHDAKAFGALRTRARERWAVGRQNVPIMFGNDVHPAAIGLAKRAAGRAEVEHLLDLTEGDIATFSPETRPTFVVSNPPYGERIADEDDAAAQAWYALGTWLRTEASPCTAWFLSGDAELTRSLRMKTSRRIPLFNGNIECRWLRYSVLPPRVR